MRGAGPRPLRPGRCPASRPWRFTACEAFHAAVLEAEGPQAQRYWGCALANLASNPIVALGGLQPLIALAYEPDPLVHVQAATGLGGFSATGNINMKIAHEGGLETLTRLLLSEDVDILRETIA